MLATQFHSIPYNLIFFVFLIQISPSIENLVGFVTHEKTEINCLYANGNVIVVLFLVATLEQ